MRLVTAQQMAAIDRRTIEGLGIDGYTLMKRAGKSVVDELVARSGSLVADRAVVLCGRGNNGGDGFVIARLLREQRADVRCYLVATDPDGVKGAALQAKIDWERDGGETIPLTDSAAVQDAAKTWFDADIIVDALLGTGLSGEVRGVVRTAIEEVGKLRVPVVAVDVPSGIDGDTGSVLGVAIQASLTVTFGLPKVGQAFHPGKRYSGTLVVADIGFPQEAIEAEAGRLFLSGEDDAQRWMPMREPNTYKGAQGTVLVVAGSCGMTGAAALTAEAALRVGAGLAYLAIPESLNDIFETTLREVITKPMPEVGKRRCFAVRALGRLKAEAKNADVIALGPGIGRHHETVDLAFRFIQQTDVPIVVDADALFALAKADAKVFPCTRTAPVILTPHYGELARLLRVETAEIAANPLRFGCEARDRFGATVLLKGDPTVVCGPSGDVWVNTTGNSGMATAGMGDVLTGAIAGLFGQLHDAEVATRLGAYVHGLAGDLARDELGAHGMIAGDVLAKLPAAMRKLG